jgi:tripartite-type tricarboxylate transporter receptor subunit TctC
MSSANLVKEGRLVGIAVTGSRRSSVLPEVPTLAEAGLPPEVDLPLWFAIYAPAGTPQPIIDWLNRESNRLITQPELVKKLEAMAFEPRTGSPADLTAVMRREQPIFAQIINDAGIKIE